MKRLLLVLPLILLSCVKHNLDPIENALRSAHPAILQVAHDPVGYEVQIIYSQIDRDSLGTAVFTDFYFRYDAEQYFYPASTVKLPMAILAMEYASFNNQKVDIQTPYTTSRDTLTHTIDDDVQQIFAVSDNEAYNRLYELIGRDAVNARIQELNLGPVRLAHRLSTSNAAERQRDTLRFQVDSGILPISGNLDGYVTRLSFKGQQKGKGFMRDGIRVNSPMDFSEKNYLPLQTQHGLIKRLFFPENYPPSQRFQLSEENRKTLLKHMYRVPRLSGYNENEFYDGYGKFFIYGDTKERIPEHIKIYNKVGYAYGTLTETAYIVDEENDVEFLLSATILVNKNGIFNDDAYQYDEIGIPFLAQLGRELYAQEYARKN